MFIPIPIAIIGLLMMLGVVHALMNRRMQIQAESQVTENNIPTGEWLNAGVVYDYQFSADNKQIRAKEAAAFTPYIEDYILPLERPAAKPYPNV